ncbi:hypothetical protein K501DRAFT_269218 [Backusella circina FSU 941]|nr:hypothetical protein K501DRAFT_269218 [Backusella circina FSU 941]
MRTFILICILLNYICISSAAIIYPKKGAVLKVGQKVTMKISPIHPDETVAGFFFNSKAKTLFGGPLTKSDFQFVVPHDALPPHGGLSEIVVVHRKNRYLQSVDTVQVKVVK